MVWGGLACGFSPEIQAAPLRENSAATTVASDPPASAQRASTQEESEEQELGFAQVQGQKQVVFARDWMPPWIYSARDQQDPSGQMSQDHWILLADPGRKAVAESAELLSEEDSDLQTSRPMPGGAFWETADTQTAQVINWPESTESPFVEQTAHWVDLAEPSAASTALAVASGGSCGLGCAEDFTTDFAGEGACCEEEGCVCSAATAYRGAGRSHRWRLFSKTQAWYADRTTGGRELAPAQLLWPRRWALAAATDPWPAVYRAEQVAGWTPFQGTLHYESVIENRAQIHQLNQVHLKEDKPLAEMTLNIQPEAGRMPEERSAHRVSQQPVLCHVAGTERGWNASTVHWNAPQTSHGPLYFEEISLERHGYTRGYLQPLFSGAYFFATVPLLPGLMAIDAPNTLQYELGEVRPGSPTPYVHRKDDWTVKAVAVEAGVILGFSYLIP